MSTNLTLANAKSNPIAQNRLLKIAGLALLSSAIALTSGCATKRTTSEVVVAPIGIPSSQINQPGYTGAINVANSSEVVAAANNLQAVVYFAFDSSEISAQSATVLNQHASLLSSNPGASVLVAGHTDERGSREYNIALGERRAQSTSAYLAAQGVAASNIQVISYGEERPVAAGSTEQAYEQNRRAELSY
jgi:peptidoglycan-associated lipoprotein